AVATYHWKVSGKLRLFDRAYCREDEDMKNELVINNMEKRVKELENFMAEKDSKVKGLKDKVKAEVEKISKLSKALKFAWKKILINLQSDGGAWGLFVRKQKPSLLFC
ncbi:hypothetical protein ACJX0J_007656, partial [Zea mays]